MNVIPGTGLHVCRSNAVRICGATPLSLPARNANVMRIVPHAEAIAVLRGYRVLQGNAPAAVARARYAGEIVALRGMSVIPQQGHVLRPVRLAGPILAVRIAA